MNNMRIGFGYDFHRLTKGEFILIGDVKIKSDFSVDAHSDGDILMHSISDAIYGAISEGDIGTHFPSDKNNLDLPSKEIIIHAKNLMKVNGYHICNIDLTIVLEKPKLQPYIEKMKLNISSLLDIKSSQVSIKSSTSQKIGIIGDSKAVACYASVLLDHE